MSVNSDEVGPELSAESQELIIEEADKGKRLDIYLAEKFPYFSRMSLRRAIHLGGALVDGREVRSAFKVRPGPRVTVRLPEVAPEGPIPEDIPLDILYEDEHLAAINKPPAMVVHPGRGHWKGTLTSALAHHFQSLSDVGGPVRPGVVHRLDRDTTGVIVIAKTNRAHFALAQQFEERVTEKEYLTIVVGVPDHDRDVIELPIGVHPYQREKMAIRANHSTSKPARTFYEVVERFAGFAYVRVLPKTGRTHQIRVHLSHLGYPVLCDKQYGGRSQITVGELERGSEDTTVILDRHALHAYRLTISHPVSNESLTFVAPLPADMQDTLTALRQYRPRSTNVR
jgi:23S rRNA pseudouridine1911/1915/1917 synthase